MIVTEEEARQKTCVQTHPLVNAFTCGASSCMAWRWGPMQKADDGRWVPAGYCGLAGKP